MIKKRIELTTDSNGIPAFQEMNDRKEKFDFGEKVGLMIFRGWYPAISDPKHMANAQAYKFPVRIGFVDDPFNLKNIIEEGATDAWNLDNWISCARQLQEDGCKVLVGGCGLTGMMQSKLKEAVDIPVFTSTMMFIPFLQLTTKGKIGVITVNENSLSMNNNELFDELNINKDSIIIRGMDQSKWAKGWSSQFNEDDYDKNIVENSLVQVAKKMVLENPDIQMIVLECTEMPPYADAVRKITGLPVFDAVQLVELVYNMVK